MVAVTDLHQDIRTAIEHGDIERAQRICREILGVCPQNLETLLLEAELHLETGEPRLAVAGFERVLAGDPEAYLACAGLAIAYEGLRDPAAALHWYTRALDLEPQNREVRHEHDRLFQVAYPGLPVPDHLNDLAVARSFVAAGFGAKALETYHTALEREPGRLEIRLGLAELLWQMTHTAEADAMCHLVLSIAPHAVKAHALLACIAAEAGDLERGRARLGPVYAQDPAGRVAAHLIRQTSLAPWATRDVELHVELGTASRPAQIHEAPTWTSWMRHALWQVLRLVLPPDEPATEREPGLDAHAGVAVPRPHHGSEGSGEYGASLPSGSGAGAPSATPASEQKISLTGPLGRRLQAVGVGITPDPSQPAGDSSELALISEEVVRVAVEPIITSQQRSQRPRRSPRGDSPDSSPSPG